LFFTCYFLFAKFFPVIAVAEIKHILKTSGENYKAKMTDLERKDSEKFYLEEVEHAH
jgi:molybdopterin-containing oxidoreductase family membrane subunit